jgi:release factor glutamine methyltransferase
MMFSDALRHGAAVLSAAGVDDARREARWLLLHAMGLPPNTLPEPTTPVAGDGFTELLARRALREPMAFILGHQGFWTLDLAVSPATLIPRADTETLIEAAVAARPERGKVQRILDLGTGTGALLLSALAEFPSAWGVGVDRAPAAAALAARNAAANRLADRALLLCGDWAVALAGQFDLILCNPPYIESDAIAGLMPEVAAHEPALALDGGADGLAAYRAIFTVLPRLLTPGGIAVVELGAGQAPAVADLARYAGLAIGAVRPDLAGIPRAMVLYSSVG